MEVQTAYVPERSSPTDSHYFFAYRIRISNVGDDTVQLISRHWVISDGDGNVEHVRGSGVVGE
jgi:ApaG protein